MAPRGPKNELIRYRTSWFHGPGAETGKSPGLVGGCVWEGGWNAVYHTGQLAPNDKWAKAICPSSNLVQFPQRHELPGILFQTTKTTWVGWGVQVAHRHWLTRWTLLVAAACLHCWRASNSWRPARQRPRRERFDQFRHVFPKICLYLMMYHFHFLFLQFSS